MTTMMVMPSGSYDWTVNDLDRLPDDGLRYELLDGLLLVSPAPSPLHQDVVHELVRLLDAGVPSHLRVYFAPVDWRPDRNTSLQPDVLAIPRADTGGAYLTAPLALAVEVLSPSTRRKDQLMKFSKYAEAGVASYWIMDPDVPSLDAYDLVDGRYELAGRAAGAQGVALKLPFPVTVVPAALTAG